MEFRETVDGELSVSDLQAVVRRTLSECAAVDRVLLIHPDYSRHDFSSVLIPLIYRELAARGMKRLDTLNAAGTHRPMSEEELQAKTGLTRTTHPLLGRMCNHRFDDPTELVHVGDIPAKSVRDKTHGHLSTPLRISVNRMLTENYDLLLTVSGTVPHEATGFSGGTKVLFPGVSGPEVTGLFHWAAVLIGVPEIIGQVDNPARDVVDEGAKAIFTLAGERTVIGFDMVFTEGEQHRILPKGLYGASGFNGFREALHAAAALSAKLHICYLDEPKQVVVQRIPEMYDEVWTAGKGSYKLQRPGVLAEGAEIILFAPHIRCFHSNRKMDADIRRLGYHGRDYVLQYCEEHPEFSKNVAAHVINVRGIGRQREGSEEFPFRVTLATQIPEAECREVNLGWRDPASLREEDFQGPGKLWVRDGGQWLYSRRQS